MHTLYLAINKFYILPHITHSRKNDISNTRMPSLKGDFVSVEQRVGGLCRAAHSGLCGTNNKGMCVREKKGRREEEQKGGKERDLKPTSTSYSSEGATTEIGI